jgi:uncharacterized protein (TIGR03067 family)
MVTCRILVALLLAARFGGGLRAEEPVPKDLKPLQGTWEILADVVDGLEFPKDLLAKSRVIFAGDQMTQKPELEVENGTFKLGKADGFTVSVAVDATRDPKHFDIIVAQAGQKVRAPGIFLLEKEVLKICVNPQARPKEFTSKAGSGNILLLLRRARKEGTR